jgi:hypothetical protein
MNLPLAARRAARKLLALQTCKETRRSRCCNQTRCKHTRHSSCKQTCTCGITRKPATRSRTAHRPANGSLEVRWQRYFLCLIQSNPFFPSQRGHFEQCWISSTTRMVVTATKVSCSVHRSRNCMFLTQL